MPLNFLLISLVVLFTSTVLAAPVKPVKKGGYVVRAVEQEEQLKLYITGIYNENQKNREAAAVAKSSQEAVFVSLDAAVAKADSLQKEIDVVQKQADRVPGLEKDLLKAQKAVWFWRCVSGVLSVIAAVAIYLLFK